MSLLARPQGLSVNFGHPLASGLFAALLFGEGGGGTIADLVAGRNQATQVAGMGWKSTQLGVGLSFVKASSQYTKGSGHQATKWSRVTWFRLTTNVGQTISTIAENSNLASRNDRTQLVNNSGQFESFVFSGSGIHVAGTTNLANGALYCLVSTHDAVTLSSYVNGRLEGSIAAGAPDTGYTTPALALGYNAQLGYCGGEILAVFEYTRTLTAGEVQWLYAEPLAFLRQPATNYRRYASTSSPVDSSTVADLRPFDALPPGLGSPMSWRQPQPPQPVWDTTPYTAMATQTGVANIVPLPAGVASQPIPPGLLSPAAWRQPSLPLAATLDLSFTGTATQTATANIAALPVATVTSAWPPGLIAPQSFLAAFPALPPTTVVTGIATQTGVARIQSVGLVAAQTGVARIVNTVTTTQSAVANIAALPASITTAPWPPGLIAPQSFLAAFPTLPPSTVLTVIATQSATARVQTVGLTATQPAVARIQSVGLVAAQTGVARVQATTTAAQTATANVAPLPSTLALTPWPPGLISPQSFLSPRVPVADPSLFTGSTVQTGTARIQAVGLVATQPGISRVQNTITATQPAAATVASLPATVVAAPWPPGLVAPQSFRAPFPALPPTTILTVTSTQTATARIQDVGLTATQPGIARIQSVGLIATQTATARVRVVGLTVTQTGTARLAVVPSYLASFPPGLISPQSFRLPFPTLLSTAAGQSVNNQTGTASIQNTATFTQTGVARIQTAGAASQSAVASIAALPASITTAPWPPGLVAPQSFLAAFPALPPTTLLAGITNQTGIARIRDVGLAATQTATARIQQVGSTATQTATTRIQSAGVSTQTAVASIAVLPSVVAAPWPPGLVSPQSFRLPFPILLSSAVQQSTATQTGTARIQESGAAAQTGVARIQQIGLVANQAGAARIQIVGRTGQQAAVARMQATGTATQTATANIAAFPASIVAAPWPPGLVAPQSFLLSRVPLPIPTALQFAATQTGTARILPASAILGTARILRPTVTRAQTGKARIRVDAIRHCTGPVGTDRHRTSSAGVDRHRTAPSGVARIAPPEPAPADRRRTGPAPNPRTCPTR